MGLGVKLDVDEVDDYVGVAESDWVVLVIRILL